jgi:hypothetical protein
MAKQSRQEYLVSQAKLLPKEQQAAAIKQINAAAKAPGGISKDKLNQLNLGIERTLYGADARGGTAGAKPGYTPREEPTTEQVPDWVLEFQRSQQRSEQAQIESQKVSARAVAKTLAAALGLRESIVDAIADLQINQGYTEQSVQVAMRDLPEFKERFAGMDKYNKNFAADIAAGRKAQVVDPFTYLELEKDYQEVLTRYGLGDMANTNTYAELIGNDVSVKEATDRVANVFDKINNADQLLKTQLQTYFPTLGTTDFAKALLTGKNPDDMAKQLERKYKRAEISSEMTRFNLQPSQTIATDLETLGVTREAARTGFGKVAEQLQPLSKLAQIYEGTTTGIEEELTSEQFRGLQSQRRKKLTEQEKATFGGSSGTSTVSLGTSVTGSF